MRSVGPYSTSGREKEGNKERTGGVGSHIQIYDIYTIYNGNADIEIKN